MAKKRTLSSQDKQYLLNLKKKPNEDDVRYKEIIKNILLEDDVLIYLLNNIQLEEEEAENDDYYGINILPYYTIPDDQTKTENFICFETSFNEVARYNADNKYQQIIFYILCHEQNNIVRDIGAARHDLIGARLIDTFHGKNMFGNQLKLISDKPTTTDNHYCTRTLVFEQKATNSLTDKDNRLFNLRK